MVEPFATPPVNPIISIRPLATATSGREATSAPTPLATLPPGTTLQGFVVNRDAQNNPILRTELGDLQMQSDVFVKTGSEIVIRVDATSESRARIISIDGLPPQDYAAQNTARTLTQDAFIPSALLQRTPGALPAGVNPAAPLPGVQAMLLSTPAAAAAQLPAFAAWQAAGGMIPNGLLKLQAGASLKIAVLALELEAAPASASSTNAAAAPPRSDVAPQGMQNPPAAGAPLAQARATTIPSPQQAEVEAIPTASMASRQATMAADNKPAAPATPAATVPTSAPSRPEEATPMAPITTAWPRAQGLPYASAQAYQTAGQPQPTTAPAHPSVAPNPDTPLSADTMPAIVIGHEPDGGNVLQTPMGVLKIYNPVPLPLHARLTLNVTPAPTDEKPIETPVAMQPFTGTTATEDGLTPLASEWPQLERMLSHLGGMETAVGREFAQALPHVGPKLTSDLLFFMAALKAGDMRQWLGNRMAAALESKAPDIAGRLKTDMAQMQQWFLHSPFDQWNSMLLPIMHQQQIDYARLYLRDEQTEGEQDGSTTQGQRFILDVKLSHLGDMQFDGFVRPATTKKQFDLVVRSVKPLETVLTNDIRSLFDTALATTGYTGYLAFQQGAQSFVRPMASSGSKPGHHAQDGQTILA